MNTGHITVSGTAGRFHYQFFRIPGRMCITAAVIMALMKIVMKANPDDHQCCFDGKLDVFFSLQNRRGFDTII